MHARVSRLLALLMSSGARLARADESPACEPAWWDRPEFEAVVALERGSARAADELRGLQVVFACDEGRVRLLRADARFRDVDFAGLASHVRLRTLALVAADWLGELDHIEPVANATVPSETSPVAASSGEGPSDASVLGEVPSRGWAGLPEFTLPAMHSGAPRRADAVFLIHGGLGGMWLLSRSTLAGDLRVGVALRFERFAVGLRVDGAVSHALDSLGTMLAWSVLGSLYGSAALVPGEAELGLLVALGGGFGQVRGAPSEGAIGRVLEGPTVAIDAGVYLKHELGAAQMHWSVGVRGHLFGLEGASEGGAPWGFAGVTPLVAVDVGVPLGWL